MCMEERRSTRRRVEDYEFDELMTKLDSINLHSAKTNELIEIILSNIKIFITAVTIAVSSVLGIISFLLGKE